MPLPPLFGTGKNTKMPYYAHNVLRWLQPRWLSRRRLAATLDSLSGRRDRDLIEERVDYCNRLDSLTPLSDAAPRIGDLRLTRRKTVYFFDCYEYLRWFDPSLRWNYLFGDIRHVPPAPTIVKSRPLVPENRASVLLNLDKVRHFVFLHDATPFSAKRDQAIFRGGVGHKPHRQRFMEMYFGHPLCDARAVKDGRGKVPDEWRGRPLTLYDHLDYKFILAIEGNDVASNLKWVMSSNSVAVMPRPTCETWFMEGTLVPERHYIEIRPDYTDLEEKLRYYIAHPDEAVKISRNAQDYVARFRDPRRELLVSLLVLQKYFRLTGQLEC